MNLKTSARVAATLVAVAALVATPSSAHADDNVTISPGQAKSGETVTISSTSCLGPVQAASDAFAAGSVPLTEYADTMTGTAEISATATPGPYEVTVTCDGGGGPFQGEFQVADSGIGPGPHTGGGGLAAQESADDPESGWGMVTLACAVLVLSAGIGSILWRHRRRRE
jgi:hypothetical protein